MNETCYFNGTRTCTPGSVWLTLPLTYNAFIKARMVMVVVVVGGGGGGEKEDKEKEEKEEEDYKRLRRNTNSNRPIDPYLVV